MDCVAWRRTEESNKKREFSAVQYSPALYATIEISGQINLLEKKIVDCSI